jgi:hypothetical protein
VAEKKSATSNGSRGPRGKLTRNPEPYSVWKVGAPTSAALVLEWYYCPLEMSSNNVNGMLLLRESPAQHRGVDIQPLPIFLKYRTLHCDRNLHD